MFIPTVYFGLSTYKMVKYHNVIKSHFIVIVGLRPLRCFTAIMAMVWGNLRPDGTYIIHIVNFETNSARNC